MPAKELILQESLMSGLTLFYNFIIDQYAPAVFANDYFLS